MDAPEQRAVIAFLTDPANHGGAAVERIDTHISTVFLAGERAVKLKKAVRLPFLDFTTLAARRDTCATELSINRRISPDLYLGVRALTREADGRLAWDGDGPAEDWVVEMRRFPADTVFDTLADTGRLDRALIEGLIERVARMHRDAPVPNEHDGSASLSWVIDTNRDSMRPFVPAIFSAASIDSLAAKSRAALDSVAPLLAARAAAGRLRRCHGDLHLGNICLWQGEPTLFDAIEFSDRLSCIDVFYDLSFLLMDLDQRGLGRLASLAMNHYLDLTGDYDGALALPLFLSLRAAVRAHVAAATGQMDRAQAMEAAAHAYLSPPMARLVAVGGLSGSGKSRLARDLAPHLGVPGAVVVRSDAVRKQIMGVNAFERLGPEGYTAEVTARTYDTLVATCARLLAGGRAVIADAVFARADERDRIEAAARQAGTPFDGLWLDIPPDLAAERIRARRANLSDATPEVLERQQTYDTGPIAWTRIDSSAPKAATLDAAARAITV